MYRNVKYLSHVKDACMPAYVFAVETCLTVCISVHFPCEQRLALMTCD